jgi:polyphosphate kinase 2 (PPK2 family)
VGDLKERERWDDYMQYYEEAINNFYRLRPWYVILPTIKKCAVILWVKSFGRNAETLIFKRLKWMRKLKNIELYKEMLAKE